MADPGTGTFGASHRTATDGIGRLPLVDDGTLEGIVLVDDLHERLADDHQQFGAVIRAGRPSY